MLILALLTFLEEKITFTKNNAFSDYKLIIHFILSSLLVLVILVFFYLQLVNENVADLAQQNWTVGDLLAFHFFEHVLDYVYISFLTVALYIGVIHYITLFSVEKQ